MRMRRILFLGLATLTFAARGQRTANAIRGAWEGPATVAVEDDFATGVSRTRIWMNVEGRRVEVHPVNGIAAVTSGTVIRATGSLRAADLDAEVSVLQAASPAYPIGESKLAVLTFDFPSMPFSASGLTTDDLRQTYFSTTKSSVASYVSEASYGKAWLTGDVFGPIKLAKDPDPNLRWTSALTDMLAAADPVVNLFNYSRLAIIWQYPGTPAWGGGATAFDVPIPGKGRLSGTVNILIGNGNLPGPFLNAAAHEFGHNLGLGHSGTLSFPGTPLGAPGSLSLFDSTGDRFSLEGYAAPGQESALQGSTMGHFAANQKYMLGWLDDKSAPQVESSGSFHLQPYETVGDGFKALHIRRYPGSNEWLWLEYRRPIGFDQRLSDYSTQIFTGALVHYTNPQTNGVSGAESRLLDFTAATTPYDFMDAALASGKSWSDPYGPLTIRIGNADASGLDVAISYDTQCAFADTTPRSHDFRAGSGSIDISAPSGCKWYATSDSDWIQLTSAAGGAGTGSAGYSVSANTGKTARHGTILAAWKTITLSQQGSAGSWNEPPGPVTLSPLTSANTTQSQVFTITAPDPNGANDIRWIIFQLFHSYGVHEFCNVEFVLYSGTGPALLADPDKMAYVPVPQPYPAQSALASKYCWLDGSSLSITRTAADTMKVSFRVLFTKLAAGLWNTNVNSVDASDLGSPMLIAYWQVPDTSCTYSVGSSNITLGGTAGTGSIALTTGDGCEWLATTDAAWITITKFKGTGSGSVEFKVNANTGTSSRTATINVFGQPVTIVQNAGS